MERGVAHYHHLEANITLIWSHLAGPVIARILYVALMRVFR